MDRVATEGLPEEMTSETAEMRKLGSQTQGGMLPEKGPQEKTEWGGGTGSSSEVRCTERPR